MARSDRPLMRLVPVEKTLPRHDSWLPGGLSAGGGRSQAAMLRQVSPTCLGRLPWLRSSDEWVLAARTELLVWLACRSDPLGTGLTEQLCDRRRPIKHHHQPLGSGDQGVMGPP